MADLENKVKETADQAKVLARSAVDDVKGEAELVKADAKGYAQSALENVKSEGKEVLQELKAAVKKEDLGTPQKGEAGYREKEDAVPNGIAIVSVVLGLLGVLFFGPLLKLLLGLVGLVLGAKARKEKQTTLATAGFIVSAAAVLFGLIKLIF